MKETKSTENPTQQENINPEEWGYRKGQKFEISPEVLFEMLPFLRKIAEQESRAINFIAPPEKEGEMPSSTRHHTISDVGREAIGAMTMITDIHLDNIRQGIAVSREVLEKEDKEAAAIPVDSDNDTES